MGWQRVAQGIYLSDSGSDVNLTRDFVGKSTGSIPLTGGQTVSIGPLSMPSLENGFNGSYEILQLSLLHA